MNNLRITRSLAKSDGELRREVEAFDPFTPTRSIPRSNSSENIESEVNFELKQKDLNTRKRVTNPTTNEPGRMH